MWKRNYLYMHMRTQMFPYKNLRIFFSLLVLLEIIKNVIRLLHYLYIPRIPLWSACISVGVTCTLIPPFNRVTFYSILECKESFVREVNGSRVRPQRLGRRLWVTPWQPHWRRLWQCSEHVEVPVMFAQVNPEGPFEGPWNNLLG